MALVFARFCCVRSLNAVSLFSFLLATFVQDVDSASTESFEWLSQLRFDFDPKARDPTEGLTVRMADARFEYGFEYLGIGERLVQTPLTDRYVFTSGPAPELPITTVSAVLDT